MEFKSVSLDELVDFYVDNRGKTCPTTDTENEYLPLIATNCITDRLYPVFSKIRSVDKETYLNWFRSHPQPGDIIFVNKGTPGKVAMVPDKVNFCIAQDMVALRIKPKFYNYYIYAVLNDPNVKTQIDNMQVGTLIPHFKKTDFKNLKLNIFEDYENQKKIGDFYMNLCKKIEVNYSIINNLEQLAQTLFKHWFIDFEFSNEQGEPYKSSGGEMVESELGEIPKEWKVDKLSNVCEVKDGTHDSPKQVENGHPLVTSKHLKNHDIDFSTTKLISEEDFIKVNKRSLVETQDILISMIGTVGRLYFVQEENINYAIKNIGLIKSSQTDIAEYIYMYFKSPFMINHIKERMTGSTQQYISLTELRKIPVVLPKENILSRYLALIKHNFDMTFSCIQENQKLEQLRDTLLPKLLSGEIEIPDDLEVK
ncbi:restriction endonuclease subunit S [Bacillus cereus]|nr:restriction endonuclease subunit S [Bacillus cereus]